MTFSLTTIFPLETPCMSTSTPTNPKHRDRIPPDHLTNIPCKSFYFAQVLAMLFDHVAEEQQEKNFTIWVHALLRKSPEHLAMDLAAKHRDGRPIAACHWKNGSFNICYGVKYDDDVHVIARFAALGRTIYRKEKVNNEVAIMKFLRQYTSIRVPDVLGARTC